RRPTPSGSRRSATGRTRTSAGQPATRSQSSTSIEAAEYSWLMRFHELITLLDQDAWRPAGRAGSPVLYRHGTKPGLLTLAGRPDAEVSLGTLVSILVV